MKIDLEFNVDTLRISDLSEEDSYGSHNSPSAGSALLNNIKNRQTVQETPDTGAGMAKVRAEVPSSKLRELLNNLPGDDI